MISLLMDYTTILQNDAIEKGDGFGNTEHIFVAGYRLRTAGWESAHICPLCFCGIMEYHIIVVLLIQAYQLILVEVKGRDDHI
jgi:hypothetical protein